jgi:hypothetical protein
MQDIYNYIPQTNHVSRVYSVAAVLYLQFVLHVTLFCTWNTFCAFTLAISIVCVQWPIWLFLQFLDFVLPWYVGSGMGWMILRFSSYLCYCWYLAYYFYCFFIIIITLNVFWCYGTSKVLGNKQVSYIENGACCLRRFNSSN